jgi:ketosteroid isomerase-like protein
MHTAAPAQRNGLPGLTAFLAGLLGSAGLAAALLVFAESADSAEPAEAAPTARSAAAPLDPVRCPDPVIPDSLADAAACGDTLALTALLAAGVDPNQADPRNPRGWRTALHHAVQRGDAEQVALLLAAGALPALPDREGRTPLHLLTQDAAEAPRIARLLIDAGAPPTGDIEAGHIAADQPPAQATAPATAAPQQAAAPVEPATPAPTDTQARMEAAIRATVDQWRAAWSHKDMDAYFACYHPGFEAEEGLSRADWMRQRQARIGDRAGAIEVETRALQIRIDGDRAEATFTQVYRSSSYQDTSRKQLELRQADGSWRIVREMTIG